MRDIVPVQLGGAQVAITGGAGGIGRALAARFTSAGSSVTTFDLPGKGADRSVDVVDRTGTASAFAELHGLDVLVVNAGVGVAGRIVDLDASDWDTAVDVNIKGTLNSLLAGLPLLRQSERGAIVIMASLSGVLGTPLLAPYAMTKHALVGLGMSMRPELATEGIGVTVVCPGPVETPLLDAPSRTEGMNVRRYLTASAGPPITPAKLAETVVAGVERNHALVTPGRAALLWRAQRFLPGTTARQLSKNMVRELLAATA